MSSNTEISLEERLEKLEKIWAPISQKLDKMEEYDRASTKFMKNLVALLWEQMNNAIVTLNEREIRVKGLEEIYNI